MRLLALLIRCCIFLHISVYVDMLTLFPTMQKINKVSNMKSAHNTGSVTVTASLEVLEKMIAENERQSGGL